eukprot:489103-Rhodomonas_salina.1
MLATVLRTPSTTSYALPVHRACYLLRTSPVQNPGDRAANSACTPYLLRHSGTNGPLPCYAHPTRCPVPCYAAATRCPTY